MGRIAGVTAEETRERLLAAAAAVFARRGYAAASSAEITSEAGLSSGAVYASYSGKAELFVAALRSRCAIEVDALLGGDDPVGAITAAGSLLDRRAAAERALLVQAIVAAQDDKAVADVLRSTVTTRSTELRSLLAALDLLDDDVAPDAVARFTLMLGLGSLLVSALDLPPVDHDDWTALISRLIGAVAKKGS
jgi:AcrR family transcriptional regulator